MGLEKITVTNVESVQDFEKIQEEAIKILAQYENEEFLIDEGGAGKVYELPGGICMKVLLERHEMPNSELYDLGNTVAEETKLQQQMARTQYEGSARVPETVAYLSGVYPQKRSAILMEKLNAVNLQHVINGTEKLPETFDLNSFFESLEDFISHMHKVEHIAHMDLYARNIMVDNETGVPYIIDFGRSIRLGDQEKDTLKTEHDWDRLEEVYEALATLQAK